jgi:dihydrolipoamide dehydrogenase
MAGVPAGAQENTLAETIYDIAVVGGGPGGYTCAIRAAQLGLKTALIEKDKQLGGTCLHVGCIPTKALLFNAEIFDHVKQGKELGIEGLENAKLNWKTIQDGKTKIVQKHTKGLDFLMRKNKIDVIPGFGKLTGPAQNGVVTIDVDGKQVKTKNVVIATGSNARSLFDLKPDDRILTNIEILSLPEIPKSMIVIGAGAVGVEFGSIYKSFGTDVTVIEYLPRLVPSEDEDIGKELLRNFKKKGIDCYVQTKVDKIERTANGVKVTFTTPDGKQQTKEADKVLIAVGRAPRTEGIGLEKTKVKVDRGFIVTDEYMQTAEPNVYAIGDIVAGMPQLAHVAGMQGIVVASKLAGKYAKPVRRNRIPGCTYCEPQIGSVGLTEAAAKEAGYKVKIGKFPFSANSKASIIHNHDGFIKVVADEKYGEVLGVHIIGPSATELIAECVVALELEATIDELMFTIHAHPTLSEGMLDAFSSVYGEAINM